MDKSGTPQHKQFSLDGKDDIPEAQRENVSTSQSSSPQKLLWLVAVIVILSLVLSAAVWWLMKPLSEPTEANSTAGVASTSESEETQTGETEPEPINIAGHRPYQQAPANDLQPIYPGSNLRMRTAAVQQWRAMSAAARANGVNLRVISGYRSLEEQQYLFFEVKKQRGQDTRVRAQVSAPPGYSEHHTGYAVDIGDSNAPATNLNQGFEQTRAFAWLQQNAARYSFELSFPRDNEQGISYEPWHWRYVGDQDSLETFYKNGDRE